MDNVATKPNAPIWQHWSISFALRAALLIAAVLPSALIAARSRTDVHPDEYVHVDAFRWYSHHWFRPPPGDRRLKYSPFGWSRVFTCEAVYFIYGRVGAVVDYFDPAADTDLETAYHVYRYINVAVLAITLGVLLFSRRNPWFSPVFLAGLIIAVPQAVYIYAYANSDGWGLSTNLWLMVYTAALVERGPGRWGIWRAAGWWALLLQVLLAKTPFRLGVAIPLALVIESVLLSRRQIPRPRWSWWITRAAVPAIIVYCLAAWWDPGLGPWRTQWKAELWDARQATAQWDFRGEVPDHWGSNRAGKGNDFHWLFYEMDFLQQTEQSVYSRFGGWATQPPEWCFTAAAWILCAGIGLNLVGLVASSWRVAIPAIITVALGVFMLTAQFTDWPGPLPAWWITGAPWLLGASAIVTLGGMVISGRRVPLPILIAMSLAPLIMAANFMGHAWASLHIDYQPQGRYLFASLVPLYFLWGGAFPIELRWLRWPHAVLLFGIAIPLSMWHLWHFGVYNPLLNPVVH